MEGDELETTHHADHTSIQTQSTENSSPPADSGNPPVPRESNAVSSRRVSWVSYYFNTYLDVRYLDSLPLATKGLVSCPACGHHFPNHKMIHHMVSHFFFEELYLGTTFPFEFCPTCLSSPTNESFAVHNQTHMHVSMHPPSELLNGCYVCPICELCFPVILCFAVHLYEKHVFRDSPYVCPSCHCFYSSRYLDLLKHFNSSHAFTNELFCPYCLKFFELPFTSHKLAPDFHVFSAHKFYDHLRRHWENETFRCDSCRMDFIYRKDQRFHEYFSHCGSNHIPSKKESKSDEHASQNESNVQSPCSSNELNPIVPRLPLKCFECGEILRHPIRHFSLTVQCPTCTFTSSCNVAANGHSCQAPDIPHSSMQSCSTKSVKSRTSSNLRRGPIPHNHCGSLLTGLRRCRQKHAPPGIETQGVLRCKCGFVTILGNKMALHLASGNCRFQSAFLDYSPRIKLFQIINCSKRKLLKFRSQRLKQLFSSPSILQSVGLCRSTSN